MQPPLNRLSRNGEQLQLEPKMMDVLVALAEHSGRVVSRQELLDAVWPETFVTESVLTRAIAGLRRALGDSAREPRYIETISRRGYRLLQGPTLGVGEPGFVVGQWVAGERFFGRASALEEVLSQGREGRWLVGMRRIGKTSFLRQLEHLAATQPERRLVPLYWDLEAVDSSDELYPELAEAIEDAGERLAGAGVGPEARQGEDVFGTLARVRRALHAQGLTLLLLLDESETLIALGQREPAILRKLRAALLGRHGLRTVLASGPRLWRLAEMPDVTSPFLDGFTPPLYLGGLDERSAEQLLAQGGIGTAGTEVLTAVCRQCGNHPYLLQLLGKKLSELGELDAAVEDVAADRSVAALFSVDLSLLGRVERGLLHVLARHASAPGELVGSDAGPIRKAVAQLRQLGLLDETLDGRLAVPNRFLRDWLRQQPPSP